MTKYYNRKVIADGYTFDSRAEYARYQELKLLEYAGEITALTVHPRYTLDNGFTAADGTRFRPLTYAPDFTYTCNGVTVAEDVKGVRTEVYKIKKRLFMKTFPHIKFVELKV